MAAAFAGLGIAPSFCFSKAHPVCMYIISTCTDIYVGVYKYTMHISWVNIQHNTEFVTLHMFVKLVSLYFLTSLLCDNKIGFMMAGYSREGRRAAAALLQAAAPPAQRGQ